MDEENKVLYEYVNEEPKEQEVKTELRQDKRILVPEPKQMKFPSWAKAVLIIASVIIVICIIGSLLIDKIDGVFDKVLGTSSDSYYEYTSPNNDFIATIYIQGEINESGTGVYDHNYLLYTISCLEYDDSNKGILLWINTPGGTVFASDELYLKLKEYKEVTGRPIYSSYQSQVTSGGYYISCLSDKIIANRNCWTGSIGVTMGQFIDVTDLLEKLGVKVNTITAGRNKAMGSYFIEMTDEQKEILQSLVDDSYEQFTGIVAEERGMDINDVIEIADGRIYTAKQALENGLIDEIGTFEDAIDEMKTLLDNEDLIFYDYYTEENSTSLLSLLGETNIESLTKSQIEELIDLNGKIDVSYMSPIRK